MSKLRWEDFPALVERLWDPTDANRVTLGANEEVRWKCDFDPEHVWVARPGAIRRGSRCSVCTNRTVQVGKNDLWTTHPKIAKALSDPALGYQVHVGSHQLAEWTCLVDARHEPWSVQVVDRARSANGCAVCINRRVQRGINDMWTTDPRLAQRLADPEVGYTVTQDSNQLVEWRCLRDERHPNWTAIPNNKSADSRSGGCRVCQGRVVIRGINDLWTTHPQVAELLVDPEVGYTVTASSQVRASWRCAKDARHRDRETTVANRTRYGCAICGGRAVQTGLNDLATTDPWLADQLIDKSLATRYARQADKVAEWRCVLNSSHIWPASIGNRARGRGCPMCAKSGFAIDLPGYLYVVSAKDIMGGGAVMQYGITNQPHDRLIRHRGTGFRRIERVWAFAAGRDARAVERAIKVGLRDEGISHCSALGIRFDGSTEAHRIEDVSVSALVQRVSACMTSLGVIGEPVLDPDQFHSPRPPSLPRRRRTSGTPVDPYEPAA